ncbi:MAG: hypothetical protein FWC41_08950 [Firmicutes bacterium]|nr:hypothetical protein [Bacillota bacterium]
MLNQIKHLRIGKLEKEIRIETKRNEVLENRLIKTNKEIKDLKRKAITVTKKHKKKINSYIKEIDSLNNRIAIYREKYDKKMIIPYSKLKTARFGHIKASVILEDIEFCCKEMEKNFRKYQIFDVAPICAVAEFKFTDGNSEFIGMTASIRDNPVDPNDDGTWYKISYCPFCSTKIDSICVKSEK